MKNNHSNYTADKPILRDESASGFDLEKDHRNSCSLQKQHQILFFQKSTFETIQN